MYRFYVQILHCIHWLYVTAASLCQTWALPPDRCHCQLIVSVCLCHTVASGQHLSSRSAKRVKGGQADLNTRGCYLPAPQVWGTQRTCCPHSRENSITEDLIMMRHMPACCSSDSVIVSRFRGHCRLYCMWDCLLVALNRPKVGVFSGVQVHWYFDSRVQKKKKKTHTDGFVCLCVLCYLYILLVLHSLSRVCDMHLYF